MISLSQIEQDLAAAIKARDLLLADTLRGLKTRLENERIAKMKDLSEEEFFVLIKSEIKRRKEAAESFQAGQRNDLADKELKEAALLEKYLPPQMSEEQINSLIDKVVAENSFTAKDFGKAMGTLKTQVGQAADGSVLARLLKEKLK